MLEKPSIPDERIISCLEDEYNVRVVQLNFLPLGADMSTAVYRVAAEAGTTYFLKLRKGFEKIAVSVPLFLKSQRIQEIIAPCPTTSKQHWTNFGEYEIILYPFIEGKDGFERELTDNHRRTLGAALKMIHTAQVPQELKGLIPKETFDPQWRESLKSFQTQVENEMFGDPTAAKLAKLMKSKGDEITRLLQRTEELASELQSQPLALVLCHSDFHGGNILISNSDDLYIVDWDNPILAPKERDLMFIGGGIDEIWKSQQEEAVFYESYGETGINLIALAYYRFERVIEDLAAFCQQLFLTEEGGIDREQAYRWFASNFEPGGTIEIAKDTDKLSKMVR